MAYLPASSHGKRTTYNHITAARRRSRSSCLQLTSAASYPPGSSLAPHGSTKQPPSTWLSLLARQWHPSVSSSISAPRMRESAGRSWVSCSRMDRAQGMGDGIHPRSEGGLEIVIRGLSTQCRDFFTRLNFMSHWLLYIHHTIY